MHILNLQSLQSDQLDGEKGDIRPFLGCGIAARCKSLPKEAAGTIWGSLAYLGDVPTFSMNITVPSMQIFTGQYEGKPRVKTIYQATN
jgi:hypothetical protein